MGKKSLLKSTSKKKNTKVKADSDKETTSAGETGEVKAAPKKAKGTRKQAAAKSAPAAGPSKETKKAEGKQEKPLSIKELVLKKFDTPKPDTLFVVQADDAARKALMSPPFVSGLDAAETSRVRKLLFKTFDLSVSDPAPVEPEPMVAAVAEKTPAAAAIPAEPVIDTAPESPVPAAIPAEPVIETAPEPPAVPVSIAELLRLKFDIVVPAVRYAPPVAASADPIEAPPFVSGLDAAETSRVREPSL
jgi:hypothetical protein